MGGMYNILANVITNRIYKVCLLLFIMLIANIYFLHSIFNVQMAIEYEKESKHELALLQLDIEQAYDNMDWYNVPYGFVNHMSKLI